MSLKNRSKIRTDAPPAKSSQPALGQKSTSNTKRISKTSSSTLESKQKSPYERNLDTKRTPPGVNKPGHPSKNGPTEVSVKKARPSPYEVSSRTSLSNGQLKKSTTSRTVDRVGKKTVVKVPEEKYDYDDDFEEDYESDFEDDVSDSEKNIKNDDSGGEDDKRVSSASISEREKTNSVLEFEILEKKVEEELTSETPGKRPIKLQLKDAEKAVVQQADVEVGAMGDVSNTKSKNQTIPLTTLYTAHNSIANEKTDEESLSEDESDQVTPESPVLVNEMELDTKEDYLKSKAQQLASRNPEAQMSFPIFQSAPNNQKTLKIDNYTAKAGYGFVFESDSYYKENERKKSAGAAKTSRGQRIQSMIKLDNISVELFHMDTVDYSRYMLLFASKNSTQVGTQTSDDNLDQEVQTDELIPLNKWTQKPPSWSTVSHSNCDVNLTRQEALGVGTDDIQIITDRSPERQFQFLQNFQEYSRFVSRASDLILSILELDKKRNMPIKQDTENKGGTKFTKGLSILKKLEVHTLACKGEYVACSNGQPATQIGNSRKYSSKNMITIWHLREPSMPKYFLRVWSHVTVLKLEPLFSLTVCGNNDGSLNFWNLKDSSVRHTQYQEQTIRTPCVNTSCMGDKDTNHANTIIALEIIPDTQAYLTVLSLDTDNVLISWSCIRSNETADESTAIYFAPWSNFHVTISKTVKLSQSLPSSVETRCFTVWKDRENISFLLGSNLGYILRGTFAEAFIDAKPKMEEFQIDYNLDLSDFVMKVTCIALNEPLSLFAAGFEDAYIRIFTLKNRRCILTIDCNGLVPWKMSWSQRRPPNLYVGLTDRVEIWDFLSSDLKPWKSIPLKKLKDFSLVISTQSEFLITIVENEVSIFPFTSDIKIMSSKDERRLNEFLRLLSDNS